MVFSEPQSIKFHKRIWLIIREHLALRNRGWYSVEITAVPQMNPVLGFSIHSKDTVGETGKLRLAICI